MNKLKIIVLMVVSATLAPVVVASSAQAASKLTLSSGTTTILTAEASGSQTFTPTKEGGTFVCKKFSIAAQTVAANAETIEVAPSYSECKFNAALSATFDPMGCKYQFSNGVTVGTTTTWTKNIVCPAGSGPMTFKITGSNCVLDIGPQDVGTFIVHNVGPALSLTFNQTSLAMTLTFSECSKTGSHTDGTYTGNANLKGFADSGGSEGSEISLTLD